MKTLWVASGLILSLALALNVEPGIAQERVVVSQSESWFTSLNEATRKEIQNDLILTGHYGGIVDGEFGPSTNGAIVRFQSDNGFGSNGILNSEQRSQLSRLAQIAFDSFGMVAIDRSDIGLTTFLPSNMVAYEGESDYGPMYLSDAALLEFADVPASDFSFRQIYENRSTDTASRNITYRAFNEQRFVVSGVDDGRYFYELFRNEQMRTVGFLMKYDDAIRKEGGIVSVFLASNFVVDDASITADAAPKAISSGYEKEDEDADIVPVASGSGFFFAPKGMLVTNQHVIDGCDAILVEGYGTAVVLKQDKKVDLAVLQLTNPGVHEWADLRLTAPTLGEPIILLGYPLSDILNSSLTVATGIVSSENGGGLTDWFMTNAGIQPGNSGGPVVDEDGLVVGVAVAKISDALLAEQGVVAPDFGFAIKSSVLSDFVSIFAHVPAGKGIKGATTASIVADARKFTVQMICLK